MVAKSTIFKTNRSQAVRLPKEVAFPEGVKAVQISVVGSSRIITPAGSSWKEWFEKGPRASEDFMSDREQPEDQEREPL
ncbi:MAG TPA: type II toxin-antitoxin system VapB family antitoxin [Devosiaceae bacterium]|nr:type II toxin-antitoxin system VapB family antitoxin [Devosiaceae bacterium]